MTWWSQTAYIGMITKWKGGREIRERLTSGSSAALTPLVVLSGTWLLISYLAATLLVPH